MTRIKIRPTFNPHDANPSVNYGDLEFEGDEQEIEVNNESEIVDKLKNLNNDFFNKFGKRKGKVRTIIHWNPKVWNGKIIPNIKYKLDGKEKNFDDAEDLIKDLLDKAKKPIGVPLRVKQQKTKTGKTVFLSFGYYLKDGKRRWGFVKG